MPRTRRSSDENKVKNDILIEFGLMPSIKLLRNNVGGLFNKDGGFVAFGLGSQGGRILKGPSDLIGWRSITITEDMVGKTIAVFTAIETKDLADVTPEQENFIAQVQQAGGYAGVAHNVGEARAILGLQRSVKLLSRRGGAARIVGPATLPHNESQP